MKQNRFFAICTDLNIALCSIVIIVSAVVPCGRQLIIFGGGMPDRSAIFIDSGFFKLVQAKHKIKVDYLAFSSVVVGGEQNRFRTYIYDCPPYQSNPPTQK